MRMRRGYVRSSLPTESAYLCGSLNTQSLLLTPGDGFLKSRKHFLSPSARATELITQAPSKEYREHCLCLCLKSTRELTRVPRKITISFLRVWECHCGADRSLKIPRSSLHYNQHSPLTLASACFRYHQHTSHALYTLLLCACVIFKSL